MQERSSLLEKVLRTAFTYLEPVLNYVGTGVWFLADRTNSHTYATGLRLSVCPSVRNVLWLNGVS